MAWHMPAARGEALCAEEMLPHLFWPVGRHRRAAGNWEWFALITPAVRPGTGVCWDPRRGPAAPPEGCPRPSALPRDVRPRHELFTSHRQTEPFSFFWICFFDEKRASSNEIRFSELSANQGGKLGINFLKSSVCHCSVPGIVEFAAIPSGHRCLRRVNEPAGRGAVPAGLGETQLGDERGCGVQGRSHAREPTVSCARARRWFPPGDACPQGSEQSLLGSTEPSLGRVSRALGVPLQEPPR